MKFVQNGMTETCLKLPITSVVSNVKGFTDSRNFVMQLFWNENIREKLQEGYCISTVLDNEVLM